MQGQVVAKSILHMITGSQISRFGVISSVLSSPYHMCFKGLQSELASAFVAEFSHWQINVMTTGLVN